MISRESISLTVEFNFQCSKECTAKHLLDIRDAGKLENNSVALCWREVVLSVAFGNNVVHFNLFRSLEQRWLSALGSCSSLN